ncbi:helix-turn-helix domain-containing protein [Ureibacillus manganicus]
MDARSSEEGRIIKRLRLELHSEKRSAFDLEKMIRKLMENENYDIKEVAKACGVTVPTIKKYERVARVEPEKVAKAKEAGVGIHGLTDINESKINEGLKDNIFDRYLNNEFKTKTLGYIKRATNETVFKDIATINSANECLEEIIQSNPQNYEIVKTILYKHRLLVSYDKSSHSEIHNSNLKHMQEILKNLALTNYVQFLTPKQKNDYKIFEQKLNQFLNPPRVNSGFPIEVKLVKKSQKKRSSVREMGKDLS